MEQLLEPFGVKVFIVFIQLSGPGTQLSSPAQVSVTFWARFAAFCSVSQRFAVADNTGGVNVAAGEPEGILLSEMALDQQEDGHRLRFSKP